MPACPAGGHSIIDARKDGPAIWRRARGRAPFPCGAAAASFYSPAMAGRAGLVAAAARRAPGMHAGDGRRSDVFGTVRLVAA